MQVKKEEVRESIYSAALTEFKKDGYKGTTIKNISKSANVPIGNMYRYYKNKDVLFEDIVDKVYTKIIDIISTPDTIEELDKNKGLNIDINLEKIVDINTEYRDEFLILFNGCEGSKYNDFKKEFYNKLSDRMKIEWRLLAGKGAVSDRDMFIFDVIAKGLIEGFIMIFNKYDNREQLKYALKEYSYLTLGDFINRLNLLQINMKEQ